MFFNKNLLQFSTVKCSRFSQRQLSRRLCQTKIVKPLEDVASNNLAQKTQQIVAPSLFKYTVIPILGCGILFGSGLYFVYNKSTTTFIDPNQASKDELLSSQLQTMQENSRNLLNEFNTNWSKVSKHIPFWMYFTRIFGLLYNFSTIILSFPLVIISNKLNSNSNMFDWWLNKCVLSFQTSGVVFIKFGQWISCRPDLFGNDICYHMRKLCNMVQPHDMKYNKELIYNTFGMKINELFESFDEVAVKTSGSIAQVHKAILKKDIVKKYNLSFNKVAVKIRHP
eukprot:455810_1